MLSVVVLHILECCLPVYKANTRECDLVNYKGMTEGVLLTVAGSAYYHLHTLSVNYLVITVVQ